MYLFQAYVRFPASALGQSVAAGLLDQLGTAGVGDLQGVDGGVHGFGSPASRRVPSVTCTSLRPEVPPTHEATGQSLGVEVP